MAAEHVGIWASFLNQVERQPDATALVWHRQETSYAQLHELAHQARARLEHLDLAEDEAIGLLAPKSPDAVALVLACLMSGRRFLLPSPSLAEDTLTTLFEQAGCRNVVRPEPAAQETAEARAAGERETHVVARAAGERETHVVARAAGERETHVGAPQVIRNLPCREIESCDVSFMLTTSGSTGLPKIVPLKAGSIDRFTTWAADRFDIGPGRTVLNYAPLNFDLCLLDVWTTLAHGGRIVLVDPDLGTNGTYLTDLIAENDVNVIQAVPMFYRLLIDAVQADTSNGDAPTSFGSVDQVMFTGDAIPAKTVTELPSLFPQARLHNIYGCTETNDSFVYSFAPGDVDAGSPLPLGDPLPGVDHLLVDEENGVLKGAGVGELYVRTPFQTDGYLDESRNPDKFVRHPLISHNKRLFFRSGDLVHRDADDNLVLQGRNDFLVKVRGVGVNTAEVERVLLDHADVVEAAVIAVPDPVAGRKLHSVVRRRSSGRLNSLVLRQHCAQRLPQAAIPSGMEIVDDPLPKTSTGKVDRKLVELAYATRETPKES